MTVNLLDANGNVVDTMVTDASGMYFFTDLLAGQYTVEVDPASFSSAVEQTYDLDDGTNTPPNSPNAATVTIAAGESNTDVDFGYRPLGTIGDTVWMDGNGNGEQDAGELGIAGVTVSLSGPVSASMTTDDEGRYRFTDLPLGVYTVTVSGAPLSGLEQTHDLDDPQTTSPNTPDTADVELELSGTGDSIVSRDDVDFGYRQLGSISGSVRDADLPSGSDGIGGVTITLYEDLDGDGVLTQSEINAQPTAPTTTTSSDGSYSFPSVSAGNYFVVETNPAGYDADVSDSDGTPEDGIDGNTPVDNVIPVIVEAGESDDDNDFVDRKLGSIGDTVWNDLNGNGVQDGEPGIDGVTVTLFDVSGTQIASQQTQNGGQYLFEGLAAGDYSVVVSGDPLNGLTQTYDLDDSTGPFASADASSVSLSAGEDNLLVDFGYMQLGVISGVVLEDSTGDNQGDRALLDGNGDPVVVMLELFEADAQGNPVGTALALTTANPTTGAYQFSGLMPGDYVVVQEQPAGFNSISDQDETPDGDSLDSDTTVDDRVAVTLDVGETEDDSNNFVEQGTGSIEGNVLVDNGNGSTTPLAGVTLTLLDDAGNEIATATSGSDGSYSFTNLLPGDYTVVQTQPAGLTSVTDEDQQPDGDPQDNNTAVDEQIGVNLSPGEVDAGNNFIETAVEPMIDIRKQAEGEDSRAFEPGDTVEFEIEVTNTGTVDLNNVVVSDPQLPACDRTIGFLAAGESVTYSCSTVLGSGNTTSKTWLDNFSPAYSYSGNDGNTNFLGSWSENDPQGGGASSGRVLVGSNYKMWMNNEGYPGGSSYKPSAQRAVDLTDMDSATLSFDWITHSGVDSNDAVALEVSTNGGSTFAQIDKFWGANTGGKHESYDVSAYISSNTIFRFRVTNYYGGSNETFKLDNFKIVASGSDPVEGFTNIAYVTGEANGETVTDSDPSQVIVGGVCIPQPSDSNDGNQDYSIWINGEYFKADSNNSFTVNAANGTANYTGSVTSNSTGVKHAVNINFGGFTTTAPTGSPKLPGFSVDATDWEYYTTITGYVGPYTLQRRGPAFQIGYGANMNDTGYGASGWMTFTNGSTTLNGDINISLTDCEEPPVVCEDCVYGQSEITLKVANWSSNRDQGETIRVREGGLGGAILFEGQVANGGSFTFNVNNPGTTIVITVQGDYHPDEYVKGMFVTDCDLQIGHTNGNSYITFQVTDLVGDGEDGDCSDPVDPVDPVTPPPAPVTTTTITNAYAGNCLDTLGTDTNSSVYKRACSGADHQQWELKQNGSYYEIINKDSNLCLDVYNSSSSLNSEVGQWTCGQSANQLWQVQSYGSNYLIKSKSSGMCLEVQSTGHAYQYTCDGWVGQRWNLALPQ